MDQELLSQAYARAAGAPLIAGNRVTLLRNAAENYPAWLEAIRSAQKTVHFECYIIRDDDAGAAFAEALTDRARKGVRVRVLHDWLGALGKTPGRYWRTLQRAGATVRSFNPPRVQAPLGWLHRDHRKALTVDSRVAFVSGLCVGKDWVGDAARGVEPWRDTGVEVRGPAIAAVEAAFARSWAAAGSPLSEAELATFGDQAVAGDVPVRVVATEPWTESMLRLDQLVAASARQRLWLTDAYFVGTPSYIQDLMAAVHDGVDVRLLVPGGSDVPVLRPLSQAGFRPLLESGIRVFEWKGPMLHAKTAVVDDRWARVGSSNLNVASWIGNWELDVVVEDAEFARAMARMYLDDLGNATEIVLARALRRGSRRARIRVARAPRSGRTGAGGSAGRVTAGALRLGHAAGAAITDRRVLGPAEARVVALAGLGLVAVAIIGVLWPRLLTIPLALFLLWAAVAMLARALELRRSRGREQSQTTHAADSSLTPRAPTTPEVEHGATSP